MCIIMLLPTSQLWEAFKLLKSKQGFGSFDFKIFPPCHIKESESLFWLFYVLMSNPKKKPQIWPFRKVNTN